MKMHKLIQAIVVVGLPLMLVSSIASAHSCSCWRGCYSDARLVDRVVTSLRADPSTTDQGIYVGAYKHQVKLMGKVGTEMQKQRAVDITRYTCGVSLVVDGLSVRQP